MGRKHVNCLIVKWPFLLCCYEILQSTQMSVILEIKPSIRCKLTFEQKSEVKPQAKVGWEGDPPANHSLKASHTQNNFKRALWCISWPLDDDV